MDGPASVEGLVVAGGVDGKGEEEFALLGHDADLSAGREHNDGFVPVSCSDADVSEAAAIAQGDRAKLVDAVVTDAYWMEASSATGPALTLAAKAWAGVRPSRAR